jgi:hypothetical protein
MEGVACGPLESNEGAGIGEGGAESRRHGGDQLLFARVKVGSERAGTEPTKHGGTEEKGNGLAEGEHDGREKVPLLEAKTAVASSLGDDGDAERAEGIDVAVDGPRRDLEAAGEIGSGETLTATEKEQDTERAFELVHGAIPRQKP